MHQSSLKNMKMFRDRYLTERREEPLLIFDLGSCDINGSYRPFFGEPSWNYRGMDREPGPNVDIVLDDPYRWRMLHSRCADVVISGQAFEHIEYFWITMLEIARVLKPGGLCCLIAPSGGYEHRYPVDCWRFYGDGFRALARFARLDVKDIWTDMDTERDYSDESALWRDTVMVCAKPEWSLRERIMNTLAHRVLVAGIGD